MPTAETQTVQLRFDGVEPAEAARHAKALQALLRDSSRSLDVSLSKDDHNTLDFGTLLTVVISSGAVLALAEGVRDYVRRNRMAKVKITRPDGTTIEVEGDGQTALELTREANKSP